MLLFRGQFISLILLPRVQIYIQICCSPCSPIVKQSYVSCIDKMFLLHPITSVAVHCCSQSIHIPISWFLLHFKSFVLAHRQVSTHLLAHSNLQPANKFFSPLFCAPSSGSHHEQETLNSGFHFHHKSPTHWMLSSAAWDPPVTRKFTSCLVLVWAGTELIFFIVAPMVLCFGLVTKTA